MYTRPANILALTTSIRKLDDADVIELKAIDDSLAHSLPETIKKIMIFTHIETDESVEEKQMDVLKEKAKEIAASLKAKAIFFSPKTNEGRKDLDEILFRICKSSPAKQANAEDLKNKIKEHLSVLSETKKSHAAKKIVLEKTLEFLNGTASEASLCKTIRANPLYDKGLGTSKTKKLVQKALNHSLPRKADDLLTKIRIHRREVAMSSFFYRGKQKAAKVEVLTRCETALVDEGVGFMMGSRYAYKALGKSVTKELTDETQNVLLLRK